MKLLIILFLLSHYSINYKLKQDPDAEFDLRYQRTRPIYKQINYMRTENKQKFEYFDPDWNIQEFQSQPIYIVPDYAEFQRSKKYQDGYTKEQQEADYNKKNNINTTQPLFEAYPIIQPMMDDVYKYGQLMENQNR